LLQRGVGLGSAQRDADRLRLFRLNWAGLWLVFRSNHPNQDTAGREHDSLEIGLATLYTSGDSGVFRRIGPPL
jgi:hypothetical protein